MADLPLVHEFGLAAQLVKCKSAGVTLSPTTSFAKEKAAFFDFLPDGVIDAGELQCPGWISPMSSQISRRVPDRISIPRRITLYFRNRALDLRTSYLRYLGMDIGVDTQISLKAHLDRTNPRGIHIGHGTLVAFGAAILSHDLARVLHSIPISVKTALSAPAPSSFQACASAMTRSWQQDLS